MVRNQGFPFTAYRGEISNGDHAWPIRFQISKNAAGELRFLVKPIPYNSETVELSRAWDMPGQSVPYFTLKGVSSDGVSFESEHITISTMGRVSTPAGTTLSPRFKCSKGRFRSEPDGEAGRQFVRYWLRGFEAFPEVQAMCRLGVVTMQGKYPRPKTDRISGFLQIVPSAVVEDFVTWRRDSEALCLHLQRYMSFAQSSLIRAPIGQAWDGKVSEETVYSQTRGRRTSQAVIHPMMLQAYFERAVAAFFDPPIAVSNATFPLEWFAMDAAYTETRLMNAMTALENLTDSNLTLEETTYLADKRFEKMAKAMRVAARKFSADSPRSPGAEPSSFHAEAAMLAGLSGKMRDLNRRPLNEKILILAERWGVPLGDLLVDDALPRAIRARNKIVHRGWYYEPAADTAEQRDLWDHVLLMREIVIRFVLTSLAYQGRYMSFRGGQHDVDFPPVRNTPNAGSTMGSSSVRE